MTDQTTDDGVKSVEVTVPVEKVVKALHLNATNGVDDRTIAAPQRDGATAQIRRRFRGSERYDNPQTAPIHVNPRHLVDEGFERPPRRGQTANAVPEIPPVEQRTEDDEALLDEQHEIAVDVWETDVRGMIEGSHDLGQLKNVELTLVGVETEANE